MAASCASPQSLPSKEDHFISEEDPKTKKKVFLCKICHRKLASKQNMMQHLFKAHDMSPVKRQKKKYLADPSLPIPERTAYRFKKAKQTFAGDESIHVPGPSSLAMNKTLQLDISVSPDISMDTELELHLSQESDMSSSCQHSEQDPNIICDRELTHCSDLDDSFYNYDDSVSSDEFSDEFESSNSDMSDVIETEELQSEQFSEDLPDLAVLACFLKHNLSVSTSKDIIKTMKENYKDSPSLQSLDFDKTWENLLTENTTKEIHYCLSCSEIFPQDHDMFHCQTPNCSGMRYKGAIENQLKKNRQPVASFILADIGKQLKSLLESPGIWDDIMKNKLHIHHSAGSDSVKDITSGSYYRQLMMEGKFLHGRSNSNITATVNTDGINLYSSSRIELWPIFLAINELSPEKRFARENIILAGVWQGKGKPPFFQYMKVFSEEMNEIYHHGVFLEDYEVNVRLAVICCTSDLPAKAGLLNMTLFNGAESCIACEEPGKVVKQGKGHCRSFPYRPLESTYPQRSHEQILESMKKGTPTKRCKGFKGESGLIHMESLKLPVAMVPDYMHGVLLGITKTLMYKWFSSTESKKEYFIGNKLKEISKRLQNVTPPDSIERLPRNLETSYTHFKATEYQTWLLFYSLPCLTGILPHKYLDHFSYLSESVHILLGDNISSNHLEKAQAMLTRFYQDFATLYPEGSCGLNVHNVGAHLVYFVKEFGPLWAWSCFCFEDSNAMILQAVHGTGNVMKQVIRFKEAQGLLRSVDISQAHSKKEVKSLRHVTNCDVASGLNQYKEDEYSPVIKTHLPTESLENIKLFNRCVINGKKFFSESYTRMKRRTCFVIMTSRGDVVAVKYFFLTNANIAFAAARKFEVTDLRNLAERGHHLVCVQETETRCVIPVEELKETLIFIKTNPSNLAHVARLPNKHGRAVFK